MGSVCCAARDSTMAEANGEILRRSIQYSPSWGVRWDNRGRVAGEETPVSIIVENVRRNNTVDNKSDVSEVVISEGTFESNPPKSLLITEDVGTQSKAHVSESHGPQNTKFQKVEPTGAPAALDRTLPIPIIEPNVPSASYWSTSPLPPRSQLDPTYSAPSKWSPHIPKSQFLRQGSGSQLHGPKSHNNFFASEGRSPLLHASSFESTRVLNGGLLDSLSVQHFPESTTSTHMETSVEGELFGSYRHKLAQSHSRKSESYSNELETCVVCSKYLMEKSSFSSQKILPNNELSVVAILVCGHVYHADCLDHLTPEISKYDPPCPVCTFGEQKVRTMFEKLLKEELDLKRKKHRSRIGNSDIIPLSNGTTPKLEPSLSLRSSFSRPFLKRHISFRSKANTSSSETPQQHIKKRTLLPWSKSSK